MLVTLVMRIRSTKLTKVENQAIKVNVGHLHILKLLIANFQKIYNSQILIRIERVVVQKSHDLDEGMKFESKQATVHVIK